MTSSSDTHLCSRLMKATGVLWNLFCHWITDICCGRWILTLIPIFLFDISSCLHSVIDSEIFFDILCSYIRSATLMILFKTWFFSFWNYADIHAAFCPDLHSDIIALAFNSLRPLFWHEHRRFNLFIWLICWFTSISLLWLWHGFCYAILLKFWHLTTCGRGVKRGGSPESRATSRIHNIWAKWFASMFLLIWHTFANAKPHCKTKSKSHQSLPS